MKKIKVEDKTQIKQLLYYGNVFGIKGDQYTSFGGFQLWWYDKHLDICNCCESIWSDVRKRIQHYSLNRAANILWHSRRSLYLRSKRSLNLKKLKVVGYYDFETIVDIPTQGYVETVLDIPTKGYIETVNDNPPEEYSDTEHDNLPGEYIETDHDNPPETLIKQPLQFLIQPGSAKVKELGELFNELSKLYQMAGGSGINFKITGAEKTTSRHAQK